VGAGVIAMIAGALVFATAWRSEGLLQAPSGGDTVAQWAGLGLFVGGFVTMVTGAVLGLGGKTTLTVETRQ